MGKKTKKPGKGKEKTEKKTAKAEVKKARRESKKVSPEDDIDAILLSIQKEEAKKKEVHVEDNVPAPSPRSNCSLTVNPLKETELVLYGGEFYNGNKTFVYGDLYRFDVEKQEWKLISSPNSPPPRSAHQAVAWKNCLYIYGGEFTSPNQERFHHYKDFWVLDLKTNQWEQLNYKGCPSPRSGHRMVLYKHKIIIFGGFYDTLREVRYYNDLHVFDLDQYKWQEIKPRPGSLWPSSRSGFQFVVYQDEIYLYGGYSKEVSSSDKKVSEKGNVHSDMWCLDPKTWEWNKVKKTGMPPGPRAGFSMAVHKKRALFFGGVVDMEMEGDLMISLFLNEIYGFQLDNHRWYPLELRKEKATKHKSSESEWIEVSDDEEQDEDEDEDDSEDEDSGSEDDSDKSEDGDVEHTGKELRKDGFDLAKMRYKELKPILDELAILEAEQKGWQILLCLRMGKTKNPSYGGVKIIINMTFYIDALYVMNPNNLKTGRCIIQQKGSIGLEQLEEDADDIALHKARRSAGSMSTMSGANGRCFLYKFVIYYLDSCAVFFIHGGGKGIRIAQFRIRGLQLRSTDITWDAQKENTHGFLIMDRVKNYFMMQYLSLKEHTWRKIALSNQTEPSLVLAKGFDYLYTSYQLMRPILSSLTIQKSRLPTEEVLRASHELSRRPQPNPPLSTPQSVAA
ncbi:hypothetical protein SASPL_149021 [Salvia splendens]|uniref:DUF4110 domain-containing protein n=1 Tax=Salvia splendens TaxID=180675 RepID=A0A8X8WAF0_SALSN|nr:hypothetical protein SASPL_149021 [Salvia splendens]